MNKKLFFLTAGFVAIVAIIGFGLGMITAYSFNHTAKLKAAPENLKSTTSASYERSPFVNVAQDAMDAVVNISAESVVTITSPLSQLFQDPFFKQFLPQEKVKRKSLGSGFIVDIDGNQYIITNNHVIRGAQNIIITLHNKSKFKGKEVEKIGADPRTDVAVLRIHTKKRLPSIAVGNSDSLKIGEWVMAIGNPFGFSGTATVGVVSAKGRSHIPLSSGPVYQDFIQTDAAINPGNSGGPLLNINGKVIGINTAIASPSGGNIGIGFAIPINLAMNVVNSLITKGKVVRGYMGIVPQEITDDIKESLDLPSTNGVLVVSIQPDSPAEKAGLQEGDVIVKYNNKVIPDVNRFRFMVAGTSPGKKVKLQIIRDGKKISLQIKIGEMPEEVAQVGKEKVEEKNWMGINVISIVKAREMGFKTDVKYGVVIRSVKANSPADDAGLTPGDIIQRVGDIVVKTIGDYNKAMKKYKGRKRPVLFKVIKQGGEAFFVPLKEE